MNWRELWRVTFPNLGLSDNFVSLDYTARVAHVLNPQAEVVQQAKVFYDTLDKCRKLTPQGFVAYAAAWRGKEEELVARDPEKAEAFLEAINVHEHELRAAEAERGEADLEWLFDREEGA